MNNQNIIMFLRNQKLIENSVTYRNVLFLNELSV